MPRQQPKTFNAEAFYHAAVASDGNYVDSMPQDIGQHFVPAISHFPEGSAHEMSRAPSTISSSHQHQENGTFERRRGNWNPPGAPNPDPSGLISAEQNAEYIQALFHYMHNLHQQKMTAYQKLEEAVKKQMDLEAENRTLKGMIGIPHYTVDETNRVELVCSASCNCRMRRSSAQSKGVTA